MSGTNMPLGGNMPFTSPYPNVTVAPIQRETLVPDLGTVSVFRGAGHSHFTHVPGAGFHVTTEIPGLGQGMRIPIHNEIGRF